MISLITGTLQAQTVLNEEIKVTNKFNIGFYDTTYTQNIEISCVYKSGKGYEMILKPSGKDDSSRISLGTDLNFYVFEFEFNKVGKESLDFPSTVLPTSEREVYQMAWNIKHPGTGTPSAGTLGFRNYIKVFNDTSKLLLYEERKTLVDTLAAKKILNANIDATLSSEKITLMEEKVPFVLRVSKSEFYRNAKRPGSIDSITKVIWQQYNLDEFLTAYRDSVKADSLLSNATKKLKSANQSESAELAKEIKLLEKNLLSKVTNLNKIASLIPNISRTRKEIVKAAKNIKIAPEKFIEDYGNVFDVELLRTYVEAETELTRIENKIISSNIYKIKNIEIQFERGYIERIKAFVDVNGSTTIFENIYAIGFSSTRNYKNLHNTKLYTRNSLTSNAEFIYLSDLFSNYDNKLDNYTRDYSPADTTILVDPSETPKLTLNRDKYENLFDARIYSDLQGTNQNNPNGLFQIEISKRFNLNTVRNQLGRAGMRAGYGAFDHFELWGAVNKIEQANRKLTLQNANVIQNGSLVSPYYATNLDFTRYENYSMGGLLNFFLLDKPDQKYMVYFDLGVKYGHVLINDTVQSISGPILNKTLFPVAHTVTFQLPRISLEFFSESRLNLLFSYSLNNTLLFSNNTFKQVASYQKSDLTALPIEPTARWFNKFELFVKVAPGKEKSTHIFLRLRFFTQAGDANTSFSQFQVGYSYNWSITK